MSKDEWIESLKETHHDITDEWLDEDFNDHGSRRDNLDLNSVELVERLLEIHKGKEAVDNLLSATADAWKCADALIRVVDSMFYISNRYGEDEEPYNDEYYRFVKMAVREVFESMVLALENAECHVFYDDDPMDNAENMVEGFSYGLIDDISDLLEKYSEVSSDS